MKYFSLVYPKQLMLNIHGFSTTEIICYGANVLAYESLTKDNCGKICVNIRLIPCEEKQITLLRYSTVKA